MEKWNERIGQMVLRWYGVGPLCMENFVYFVVEHGIFSINTSDIEENI